MSDDDRTELDDWRRAAKVEASLRREFLARAETAEAETERLRAFLRGVQESTDLDEAHNMARRALENRP